MQRATPPLSNPLDELGIFNFVERPRPGPPLHTVSLPAPSGSSFTLVPAPPEASAAAAEAQEGPRRLSSPSPGASPSLPTRRVSGGASWPETPSSRAARVLAWSDFGLGSLAAPLHREGCVPGCPAGSLGTWSFGRGCGGVQPQLCCKDACMDASPGGLQHSRCSPRLMYDIKHGSFPRMSHDPCCCRLSMDGLQHQRSLAEAKKSTSIDHAGPRLSPAPVSSPLAGKAADAEHPLRMSASLPRLVAGSEAWDISFTQPSEPKGKTTTQSSASSELQAAARNAQHQAPASLLDL